MMRCKSMLIRACGVFLVFQQAALLRGQPAASATPGEDWVTSMPAWLNDDPPDHYSTYYNGKEMVHISRERAKKHWHSRFMESEGYSANLGWSAEMFFDDPLVIRLYNATVAKDIDEMRRLIAAGADVNAVGEEGMTLLYVAFYVNDDPRPFGVLLDHGADPNVVCSLRDPGPKGDFRVLAMQGNAVVHLASRGPYNRHFKNIFEHGGDPNLPCLDPLLGPDSPWHTWAHGPDAIERLQVMIDNGADLNSFDSDGKTYIQQRLEQPAEQTCKLVLMTLKAGADWRSINNVPGSYHAIHLLAANEEGFRKLSLKDYDELVAWLEEHGESLEDAKKMVELGKERVRANARR
jgi:hypothetical protein